MLNTIRLRQQLKCNFIVNKNGNKMGQIACNYQTIIEL